MMPEGSFTELINSLKSLKSLETVDLSHNHFTSEQFGELGYVVMNSSIKQIILQDFSKEQQKQYSFDELLIKSRLKSLTIEFDNKNINNLQKLIETIARSKELIIVNLQLEKEIDSKIYQPLNHNQSLEQIKSNQLIPIWLKQKISQNIQRKSSIINFSPFEEPEINYTSKVYNHIKMGLSLDGGGTRGLLIATQLNYLCKEVGYPLHKIFDMIGGTSIGGILALANTGTIDGVNPICGTEECIKIFTHHGSQIFKKSQGMSLKKLFYSGYDHTPFQKLLNRYFKNDCKLSDVFPQTGVIVTAINRLDNKDYIFRSKDALFDKNKDFYMRDVARATSAAPTYFSSAQIKNITATQTFSFVDGGIGLNNPSILVIDEIKKMAYSSNTDDKFFLLSLGTGSLPCEAIPETAGLVDVSPIVDSFTQSCSSFVNRQLQQKYSGHFLRVSPVIDIDKKECELDNTDENTMDLYTTIGQKAATRNFSQNYLFGRYRTKNLIDWLKQNTEDKIC